MRRCEWCGISIVTSRADARYCSSKCRVYAHRATIPNALTKEARWMRYDATKRPLQIDGRPASSTDPNTWTTYAQAKASTVGVGIGFALGDGYAGIDLDHCIHNGVPTPEAAAFIADYPEHYIEYSPSGDGLHILGTADPGPGTRRTINGLRIERYTTGRYFAVTGRIYQRGQLLPL